METSLKEATMNEVFYYNNPMDEKELKQTMLEILNNRPSDEKLKKIAKKFEKEYNKEKIAKEYINLINKILKY